MFNSEIKAGMLAINIRLDNIQKAINGLPNKEDIELVTQKVAFIDSTISQLAGIMQDLKQQLAEKSEPEPFKTKEGLFNYKHRKLKE